MSTEPINPGNPYGTTSNDIFAGETLTGEALLQYINSRLSNLDEDINALMGQLQDSIKRKEYLNDVKEWADRLAAAQASGDDELVDEVNHSFPDAPPGERPLRQELRELFSSICPARKDFTTENMTSFKSRIDDMLDEINGQSELDMIRLQQLMGQRQVSVQTTTNLMAKLNQGFDAIVGNLR